ncbi:MAG: hypothetical protein ACE14V_11040 [bacterium]
MDDSKLTAKEIFLATGNAVLGAGVAGLSTTSLPAVLPAVFVGAFCFQVLQHLWQKRQAGKKLDINQLAAETDALKEALTKLGLTEQKHYDQIEECLRWICIALNSLGDRVKSLEEKSNEQKQEIGRILSITTSQEQIIIELTNKIKELLAPREIRESLSLALLLTPSVKKNDFYKALVNCSEGTFEFILGQLNIPSGIIAGRTAAQAARANDLITWANGLTGPGLGAVYIAYIEATTESTTDQKIQETYVALIECIFDHPPKNFDEEKFKDTNSILFEANMSKARIASIKRGNTIK